MAKFQCALLGLLFISSLLICVSSETDYSLLAKYVELFPRGILYSLGNHLKENPNNYNYLECASDILSFMFSLEPWALLMHDANGKLPPGILNGHLHTLGSYDECLGIYNETDSKIIKGKYCLARLTLIATNETEEESRLANTLENVGIVFNWGVCMPNSCKAEEIQSMLREMLQAMNYTVSRVPLINVPENECYVDEKVEWSGGAIAALTILSFFAFLMLTSSIYDFYTKDSAADTRLRALLISFSMYTNTKKLVKPNKSSSNLRCLNGIRVMSIFWVILGHRYTQIISFSMLNHTKILSWTASLASALILNGTFAVDTFLVLSGLLVAYTIFSQAENDKSFNILLFYLHRFLRLWPAMAMTILVQFYLYEYLGNGPYWFFSYNIFKEPCRDYWWSALLYVQNYVNSVTEVTKACVAHLWYVCVDTQLYILSPILIYPLMFNRKYGLANLIFWIVLSQVSVTTIVYLHNWGSAATAFNPNSYLEQYYNATHARATPWLLGFATGYLLCQIRHTKIKINKILVVVYWIFALAVMVAVIVGGGNNQGISHEVNKLEDGTFNAFARTSWAIAVIMVILACVKGYGGPVNWLLSFRIWEVLGKLTYSMYLLHIGIQSWQRATSKTTSEFSHFQYLYNYCGDVIFTVVFSYFWVMAFESPFLAIEKVLFFKKKPASPISKTNDDEKY